MSAARRHLRLVAPEAHNAELCPIVNNSRVAHPSSPPPSTVIRGTRVSLVAYLRLIHGIVSSHSHDLEYLRTRQDKLGDDMSELRAYLITHEPAERRTPTPSAVAVESLHFPNFKQGTRRNPVPMVGAGVLGMFLGNPDFWIGLVRALSGGKLP